MTIYVDEVRIYPMINADAHTRRWGNEWCHMFTDGDMEALHQFAESLGLKRAYFQNHHGRDWMAHYDITPWKRQEAIKKGAVEIGAREWMKRYIAPTPPIEKEGKKLPIRGVDIRFKPKPPAEQE